MTEHERKMLVQTHAMVKALYDHAFAGKTFAWTVAERACGCLTSREGYGVVCAEHAAPDAADVKGEAHGNA